MRVCVWFVLILSLYVFSCTNTCTHIYTYIYIHMHCRLMLVFSFSFEHLNGIMKSWFVWLCARIETRFNPTIQCGRTLKNTHYTFFFLYYKENVKIGTNFIIITIWIIYNRCLQCVIFEIGGFWQQFIHVLFD